MLYNACHGINIRNCTCAIGLRHVVSWQLLDHNCDPKVERINMVYVETDIVRTEQDCVATAYT